MSLNLDFYYTTVMENIASCDRRKQSFVVLDIFAPSNTWPSWDEKLNETSFKWTAIKMILLSVFFLVVCYLKPENNY